LSQLSDLYGAEVVLSKPSALILDVGPFPFEQLHENIAPRLTVIAAVIATVSRPWRHS